MAILASSCLMAAKVQVAWACLAYDNLCVLCIYIYNMYVYILFFLFALCIYMHLHRSYNSVA